MTHDDVARLLADHEAWVDAQVPTVPDARADKHRRMAADPFGFFRATYVLWAHRLADLPQPPPGPVLDAVGDLHVENFGTWRDAEGRTVWGVNDLDEADRLPAVTDLLRLAVSALLARKHRKLPLGTVDVVDAVLDGYLTGLRQAGPPTVLESPDPPGLLRLVPPEHAVHWWRALRTWPRARPDEQLRRLLEGLLPPGAVDPRFLARTAGMGSRDRLRVVVVAELGRSPVVREAKALAAPATRYLAQEPPRPPEVPVVASRILAATRGTRDPQHRVLAGWVVRRLAPWCDRVELAGVERVGDAEELLRRMGAETAAVHLTDPTADRDDLSTLARTTARPWLEDAVRRLHHAVEQDWEVWREGTHPTGPAGRGQRPEKP